MSNRTVLVVAHRLATIKSADQILVLKDKRIVEKGTHHELLHVKGLYEQMYRMQCFYE